MSDETLDVPRISWVSKQAACEQAASALGAAAEELWNRLRGAEQLLAELVHKGYTEEEAVRSDVAAAVEMWSRNLAKPNCLSRRRGAIDEQPLSVRLLGRPGQAGDRIRTPDGGALVRCVREDWSVYPFPIGSLVRNGAELTLNGFVESLPYAAHHAQASSHD